MGRNAKIRQSVTTSYDRAMESQGSVEKTTNGAEIAEDTANSLKEILLSVEKVTSLSQKIAAASKDQTQGVEQINVGLGQIDSAIQKTTAMAETTANTAQELSERSAHLNSILSQFKLKTSKTAARPDMAELKALPSAPKAAVSGWGEM